MVKGSCSDIYELVLLDILGTLIFIKDLST